MAGITLLFQAGRWPEPGGTQSHICTPAYVWGLYSPAHHLHLPEEQPRAKSSPAAPAPASCPAGVCATEPRSPAKDSHLLILLLLPALNPQPPPWGHRTFLFVLPRLVLDTLWFSTNSFYLVFFFSSHSLTWNVLPARSDGFKAHTPCLPPCLASQHAQLQG